LCNYHSYICRFRNFTPMCEFANVMSCHIILTSQLGFCLLVITNTWQTYNVTCYCIYMYFTITVNELTALKYCWVLLSYLQIIIKISYKTNLSPSVTAEPGLGVLLERRNERLLKSFVQYVTTKCCVFSLSSPDKKSGKSFTYKNSVWKQG
jgi:hypothetical protein